MREISGTPVNSANTDICDLKSVIGSRACEFVCLFVFITYDYVEKCISSCTARFCEFLNGANYFNLSRSVSRLFSREFQG